MPYDVYVAQIFNLTVGQFNGIIVDLMTAISSLTVIICIIAGYYMICKIIAIGNPVSQLPDGVSGDVVKSGSYDVMDLSSGYGQGVSAAKLKREDDLESADYGRRSKQYGNIPRGGS